MSEANINATPEENKVPTTPVLLNEDKTPETPENKEPTPVPDGAVIEYEPTGDASLDLALGFVAKAGIFADDPAMVAAQSGDFTLLRAKLAEKNIPGWEQYANIGEAAYQRAKEKQDKANAELQSLVHAAAGSPEYWSEVQTWASANADPAEKAEINALLSRGGIAAKQAVKYLVECYEKASNVERPERGAVRDATRGGGAPNPDSGPLSPSAYAKAVQELNVKMRGRMEGSKEYDALQRRRMAFRG